MKGELQARPESKRIKQEPRPISRYANTELALQTFKKGKGEQQRRDFPKAIQLYLLATVYDPKLYQAHCNMGSCYRSLNKFMEARLQYKRSISIKPDDAISHYNLANIERLISNYDEAILHYQYVLGLGEKGIQLGELRLNSLINQGICYQNIQQHDKAIDCYQRASVIAPKDPTVPYNHAMTHVSMLNKLQTSIFQQVAKQRALKAQLLFQRVLQIEPKNQIARFQSIRMQRFIDSSTDNLKQVVSKLQKLLKEPGCTIQNQINEELGYCLKLLKDYEGSSEHYQKSMNGFHPSKKTAHIEINKYDGNDKPVSLVRSNAPISETEGLHLLEKGQIKLLQSRINQLEEKSLSKHLLQMALHLKVGEDEQTSFNSAVDIYNKYFMEGGKEISYDKISIEGHKIIGKLLSLQNNYKDSIKHFEHITSKLKDKNQSANVLNEMANDYQALGDQTMALKQYKLALDSQPDNIQIIYNVACCLSQAGNKTESIQYFKKILSLLDKSTDIDNRSKGLYKTECLVSLALASENQNDQFELFKQADKAISELQDLSKIQKQDMEIQSESLLTFYLRWADLLEQKLNGSSRKTQQSLYCKERLLQAYMKLLENEDCPDRNAILGNCATIYYEEGLFINALANFNQITDESLSYNNLALTYLHLGEHFMATQYTFKAHEQDPNDPLVKINSELVDWIYSISQSGRFYQKYPDIIDEHLVYRLQYGIIFSQILTSKINSTSSIEEIEHVIRILFSGDRIVEFTEDTTRYKLVSLMKILNKSNEANSEGPDELSGSLLKLSLQRGDLQNDFKALIDVAKSKNNQQSIGSVQTALYLFIFVNANRADKIARLLRQLKEDESEVHQLNLNRRVTMTADYRQREFQVSSLNELVVNLCSWECELQNKLNVLLKIVDKAFYHSNFKVPLQIQHHFPRHDQFYDCNNTFSKLSAILLKCLKIKRPQDITETKLSTMKKILFKNIFDEFARYLKDHRQLKLVLGQDLYLMTVYAQFQSKEDCLGFVKELQKDSNQKKDISVSAKCQQIVLILSDLIRVKCQWKKENLFETIISQLLDNCLPLQHQAVLYLQSEIQGLKESSSQTRQALQKMKF